MTVMTNAPTLPAEPLSLQKWRNSTIALGGREHEMFQHIDALRAIATTLRDQLAEAQREHGRLQREKDGWEADHSHVAGLLQATIIQLAEQTARADANEKDARRYRLLQKEIDSSPRVFAVVVKRYMDRNSSNWCDFATSQELDTAIDAALAKS